MPSAAPMSAIATAANMRILLQQGDQMFSDIGVARADVEKLFRQTRIRLF